MERRPGGRGGQPDAEGAPHLTGQQQQTWLDRLDEEYDNIRAALRWSRAHAEAGDKAAGDLGLRTGGAIWRFWAVKGLFTEGRAQLERALSISSLSAVSEAPEIAEVERQGRSWSAASSRSRAKALNGAGILAMRQGDYSSTRSLAEAALVLEREVGDQQNMSLSLNMLGSAAAHQSDYTGARALFEESLALRRELGDKWGISTSLSSLGSVALEQGDYLAAHGLYEESLALARELGDKHGMASCLNNLGIVAMDQGDYTRARALQKESLALRREIGDQKGLAACLAGLGGAALGVGQVQAGAKVLGAVEGLLWSISGGLDRDDRLPYERSVQQARTRLGEEEFRKAWQQGAVMTLEEAIEYALQDGSHA